MVLLSTHNIMFWLRNKKNNFQMHTFIWRPDINWDQKWFSGVNACQVPRDMFNIFLDTWQKKKCLITIIE